MPASPTVVLVHGAFADASGFAEIITSLEAGGHRVVAHANPLRLLSHDADALHRVVSAIDGPVLLVGHSYGGAVITQASATLTNVVGLVYLAAFGIDAGESCASVTQPYPPPLLATSNSPTPYDAPGAPGGPDLFVTRDRFHEVFCADLPAGVAERMAAGQRPLAAAAFTEEATAAGWRTIPSWFLVSTQDECIPPEAQQMMAERMGATTEAVDGSHCAFIARSAVASDFIERALTTLG